MYKFIKTKNPNNDFDNSDIEYIFHSDDADIVTLLEEFKMFLLSCGFCPETVKRHLDLE